MVQIPTAMVSDRAGGQSGEQHADGDEFAFGIFDPQETGGLDAGPDADIAHAQEPFAKEWGDQSSESGAIDQLPQDETGGTVEPGQAAAETAEAAVTVEPAATAVDSGHHPEPAAGGEPNPAAAEVALPQAAATAAPTAKSREELIQEQTLRVADIGLEIEELLARQKNDKDRKKHLLLDLEEASQKLRDLRDGKDVQQELPLVDGAGVSEQSAATQGVTNTPAESQDVPPAAAPSLDATIARSPEPPANTDTTWRKTPIEELKLDEIKGFGKKKRESLAEVAKTLGDLEDLRAEAGAMGLQSVLPDGFGEKICSEIEDKIIQWLSRNRDRAVLEQAAGGIEQYPAVADGIDLDGPPAEGSPEDKAAKEDEDDFKLRRLDYWQEQMTALPPAASLSPAKPDIAETGRHAALNGDDLDACNWTAGEEQDSWLIGYLSANV